MSEAYDHQRLVDATREAAHWKAQASNLQEIVDSLYDQDETPKVRRIIMQRREIKAAWAWANTYRRWWRREQEKIDAIKAIRSNFPEKCEVHDEDGITCGWKSMIAGIDKVLANG
jgi:hypothetical protein